MADTTIKIAGDDFTVTQPYAEGHPLTANEASALNQTFAENIRNNMATRAKALKEAGTYDAQVFQGTVTDYCDDYEFGVRTGGGRSGDPVTAEAMAITRELVRKQLVKQGHKLTEIPASKISELAKSVLAKGDATSDKILATAKARVEAAGEITLDVDTSSVQDEAPVTKGKKAASTPAEEPAPAA